MPTYDTPQQKITTNQEMTRLTGYDALQKYAKNLGKKEGIYTPSPLFMNRNLIIKPKGVKRKKLNPLIAVNGFMKIVL